MEIEILEKELGYTFKQKELLKKALTHTSYAYEKKVDSNEKLEFLGDSILEFLSSKYLFENYPNLKEGEMTKVRATVVCEKSLHKIAQKHNFSDFLYLGKSEQVTGGKNRPAILADSVEAVIAAIYIDGGLEKASIAVTDAFCGLVFCFAALLLGLFLLILSVSSSTQGVPLLCIVKHPGRGLKP